mmetsp:Transcript_1135/g.3391  ORF Transcript_1135/g.3391 Transcript_1135/m.3391 type:complete len:278 (+) Transcript_1135:298-1131(+)
MFALLLAALAAGLGRAADSLDGYGFNCGRGFVGFQEKDATKPGEGVLVTEPAPGVGLVEAGTYTLVDRNTLNGELGGNVFESTRLYWRGDVLVSFDYDLLGIALNSCGVVALDWVGNLERGSVALDCPPQNAAGNTFIENNFVLSATGGVELRSTFETVSNNDGSSVVSDYYGAFKYYSKDDTIVFYLWPSFGDWTATQQGRPSDTIRCEMTNLLGMWCDGYTPPGPCVIAPTAESQLENFNALPRTPGAGPGGPSDGAYRPSALAALGLLAVLAAL